MTAVDTGARERIVGAAVELFVRYGEAKTSVREVADAAGLSRGTVYNHFADRDALVEAVVEEIARGVLARIDTELASIGELDDQLAHLAVLVYSSTRRRGWTATSVVLPPDLLDRLLTARSAPLMRLGIEWVRGRLEAAVPRGQVRADLDAPRAAEWIVRQLFSLVTTPSVVVDLDDPEDLRTFFRDHAVRGLR